MVARTTLYAGTVFLSLVFAIFIVWARGRP
jgi:hypothetical protein